MGLSRAALYNGRVAGSTTLYTRCRVMRRSVFAGLPILLLTVAASRSAQEPALHQADYYPLKVGHQWTYRAGTDRVVVKVEKQVTLEFKRDEKAKSETAIGFQVRIISGQGETTEQVAVLDDGVYRFATAGKAIKPPLRFFKLGQGALEWAVDSRTEDGKPITGKFVLGTEAIALTVNGEKIYTYTSTCKQLLIGDKEMAITYWFAKEDLKKKEPGGLVKQHIRIGKQDITLELEEFKAGP